MKVRKKALLFLNMFCMAVSLSAQLTYPIVDTGQSVCYSDFSQIPTPLDGAPFCGQDATVSGNRPRYFDNGNGTVTDEVTGLMWEKNMGEKLTFSEAKEKAAHMRTGGYDDWRIPTIKELYSLIIFTGRSMGERAITPYIDTLYFDQPLGNPELGEREIDAQTWSSTVYQGTTMGHQKTVFGVNFIDGRIKGYPLLKKGEENRMYFRMVRGNPDYGKNCFVDNGDGTISDYATGLMWQQADNANLYSWKDALAYADTLTLAGYSD